MEKKTTETWWNGKTVLITGMNGFLGSHLAQSLLEKGSVVHGTARNTNQTPYLSPALKAKTVLHPLHVESPSEVERVLNAEQYDAIFHLASQSDTWKSIQQPYATMQTNVQGTLNLFEALRIKDSKAIIVTAGSVRVFQYAPNSTSEKESLHPYDASKISADIIASSYIRAYGLNGAIARNTNTYGENDLNFARLVPRIMQGLFHDHRITLRGDGSLRRDFMYVGDTIRGMMMLAEKVPHLHHQHREFTFATGENYSIRELVDVVMRPPLPEKVDVEWLVNQSMNDRDQPACDIQETEKKLGWKPTISLQDGLSLTKKWYADYFARLK